MATNGRPAFTPLFEDCLSNIKDRRGQPVGIGSKGGSVSDLYSLRTLPSAFSIREIALYNYTSTLPNLLSASSRWLPLRIRAFTGCLSGKCVEKRILENSSRNITFTSVRRRNFQTLSLSAKAERSKVPWDWEVRKNTSRKWIRELWKVEPVLIRSPRLRRAGSSCAN